MLLYMILLIAVLAAHPSFGARIPDNNAKPSPDQIDQPRTQKLTPVNANLMTDKAARSNKITPAPPKHAKFLTDCSFHGDSREIYGLCWIDETTVLTLDSIGGTIYKIDIDFKNNICISSVLYSNVRGSLMVCPSNGEIYVSDRREVVSIYKGHNVTEWRPYTSRPGALWGGIAVNDNLIALDFDYGPTHFYNRTLQSVYNRSTEADRYRKAYLSLSPSSSHMVASARFDDYILINDLKNNKTIKAGGTGNEEGKFRSPLTTSFDASQQYVLVSDHMIRISVFGLDGSFKHVLEIGPGGVRGGMDRYHAIFHREGKPSLLAFSTLGDFGDSIKVYSLST